MDKFKIGPWPLGIDTLSSEIGLPKGTCRDLKDGDVDRSGDYSRRNGYVKLDDLVEGSGLWTSKATGRCYCAANGVLYRLRLTPSYNITALGLLGSSDRPSFCDLLDKTVVSTVAGNFLLDRDDAMVPLGVDAPSTPIALADTSGGLAEGRYGVAYTFMRGEEESPLSPIRFVQVPQGGGVLLELPTPVDNTVTHIRTYRTTTNGDVVYAAETVVVGVPDYVLGNSSLGRQSDTIYKAKIRGGQIVRYWRGRLFVVRGRVVYFSDAMRYGLCDARHGFLQFQAPITLFQPTEGGIYIGDESGVTYLAGSGPSDWRNIKVTSSPPVFGTGTTLACGELGEELQDAANGFDVALWQAAEGFVIGLSGGKVVTPQAARLKLSPTKVGAMVVHQRRIISTEIM